jgi:hypothetical protein
MSTVDSMLQNFFSDRAIVCVYNKQLRNYVTENLTRCFTVSCSAVELDFMNVCLIKCT